MGTINCLGISIKIKKILACLFWAIFGVCLLTIPTFAAENIGGEPVDRSGTVTYISIPNEDGTFTTLEGKEAQEWYERAVREGKQRESMLESERESSCFIRRKWRSSCKVMRVSYYV